MAFSNAASTTSFICRPSRVAIMRTFFRRSELTIVQNRSSCLSFSSFFCFARDDNGFPFFPFSAVLGVFVVSDCELPVTVSPVNKASRLLLSIVNPPILVSFYLETPLRTIDNPWLRCNSCRSPECCDFPKGLLQGGCSCVFCC